MTTEQKAKAYDEALKWMRDLYPNMGIAAKEKAESIFPELCESKDERIRKTLIDFFQDWRKNRSHCWGISVPEILTWLEKQGTSYTKRDVDNAYVEGMAFAKNELEKQGNSFIKWNKNTKDNKPQFNHSVLFQTKFDVIAEGEWNGKEWLQYRWGCGIDDSAVTCWMELSALKKQDEQELPIEKLPEEMKTIGESLGFTTQEECDEYNQMVSELIMSDKVEPKFKVGDWIIDDKNRVGIIVRILDEHYIISFDGREVQISFEWEGKLFRKWSIKDAKDGDVLADDTIEGYSSPFVALYKKIDEECDFESYCFVGFDGKFYKGENGHSTEEIHPATKEQRDILFAKIKEAGYEWDENNKMLKEIVEDEEEPQNYKNQIMSEITDLVKDYIKQKPAWSEAGEDMKEALRTEYEKGRADAFEEMQNPAWSEEDETALGDALWCCKQAASIAKDENDMGNVWYAERWLKSLKDRVQPQQKWSEEDEHRIKDTIYFLETAKKHYASTVELDNCINWLKSLKERYTWKPKTWEIQILESVIEKGENPKNYSATLHSILEQLKKLKGE